MTQNTSNHRKTAMQMSAAIPEHTLDGLPAVDWAAMKLPSGLEPEPMILDIKPENWPANKELPTADIAVITWTSAEWAALNQVFCGDDTFYPSYVSKKDWREPWYSYSREYYTIHQYMEDVSHSYQGGAPSLEDQAWGHFRMAKVGDKKVLLIKSGMHLAQDGTKLPLTDFVKRICDEATPELVLSVGTAGGVRQEDALGSALICTSAKFHLLKDFKSTSYNETTVQSSWMPSETFIAKAQKQTIQVPGIDVLPISPQYPEGSVIKADEPQSEIKIVTDSPIITTDTFLFGTTTNELDKIGCIVEMDDAVVGMICKENNVPFGFVRNVSDPVINGDLPASIQDAWAGLIYKERGLYTSYNGALATWALIAGEAQK